MSGDVVEQPKLTSWLFGTRSGLLTLWCLCSAFLLLSAAAVVGVGNLIGTPLGWYYLAATTLLWLPAVLFALDAEETVASGPRLLMPMITNGLLISLTGLVIADNVTGAGFLEQTPQRVALFAFFFLAFVPRVWNAAIFAHHRAQNRRAAEDAAQYSSTSAGSAEAVEDRLEDYRNAESLGAVLATVLFLCIAGGAIYLGTLQENTPLATGIGQAIFAFVIALFGAIVFLDWIARFPPLRATARAFNKAAPRMRFLVDFYDLLDTALVRLGSHVAGADHHKTRSRYGFLILTLGSLALLAWFLPPPLGLVPVGIGLVLALSLSRLWAWVEEDRDLASLTGFSPLAPQRVGFQEDFRDETLLGFIFVLMLLPIAWMQTDQGVAQIFKEGGSSVKNPQDFSLWLGYFGFELAKALPIVDWADIYKLGPNAAISPAWPNGAHAIFLARALVDLILIASLLQAIAIANRNSQQKSLFAVRQIKRLDELVEKAALSQAIRETRIRGDAKTFDLAKLERQDLVDFRRYDFERLRQVHAASGADADKKAFIEQIFVQAGYRLEPAIDLAQDLASSHRDEVLLFRTFDQALKEHEARSHRITLHDIQVLLFELRAQPGLRDFKRLLMEVAENRVAARPEEILDMFATVAVGASDERDQFQYAVRLAAEAIRRVLPRVNDPQDVADALASATVNGPKAFGAAVHALNALLTALQVRLSELRPS